MNRFFISALLVICNFTAASIFAYDSRSAASKYYSGEISQDQYIDSMIGPMNQPKSYHGSIQKKPYGQSGYTYRDADGNGCEFTPNRYGGWDVKGNER